MVFETSAVEQNKYLEKDEYYKLKEILKNNNQVVSVGDEGGFAPHLNSNIEAVDLINKAIITSGYIPGKDVYIALDVAASEIYNKENNTYKIDKNIKLATYASRCIANEILMYIRKNKRRKTEISLEDALNYDSEGNELHLEDVMGTDSDLVADEYESKEEKVLLEKELKNLEARDKEIMIMRYGLYNTKEYTQKEVADKLSISQSYISRIEKKVIKKLKTLLRFS